MKKHHHLLLLLLLFTCWTHRSTVVTARRIQSADFKVLLQLVEVWGSFPDSKTWSTNSDCSTVQGITCDADGYVVSLSTSGNSFFAIIPDAISGLQHLTLLSVTSSGLAGPLTPALFSLPLLKAVDLNDNNLMGVIPDDISKLSRLTYLNLHDNIFKKPIPESLSRLSQLITLNLGMNIFLQTIPSAISSITTLQTLVLSASAFLGTIPDWLSTMPNLMSFEAQANLLEGTIPASLGRLTRLTTLNMGRNSLEGSIPEELGNLVSLEELMLEVSHLNGTIPASLGALNRLSILQLAWTNISGTLPSSIGSLTRLDVLYLESMRLTGTIPRSYSNLQSLGLLILNRNSLSGDVYSITSTMTNLLTLDVSTNQFTGRLPAPPSPRLQFYFTHRCFFSHGAVVPPKSNRTFYANIFGNCLPNTTTVEGEYGHQRSAEECAAFCGLPAGDARPLCSGHGVCSYIASVQESACICDSNFDNQAGPHFCTYSVLPSTESSQSTPVSLSAAATQLFNGSIILTPSASSTWGAAVVQTPIRLFHFIDSPSPCGTPFAFNVSFTFAMRPAEQVMGGEGLAFVVSAAAPQGAAAGVGVGGVGRRSVGVEFDSVLSVKHSDPNDNHVGVNVGGSPVSLASATAPLILNDAQTKHAWIHYDPTSGGTLRVFLSSNPVQPLTPTLRARVSLCSILQPTAADTNFFFSFVATTADTAQENIIFKWEIVTGLPPCLPPNAQDLALGFVLDEDSFSSQGFNSAFHYASAGFAPAQDNSPAWLVKSFASWALPQPVWPVKNQRGCADSWAYAVVAAVEAAYSIASNWSQPPVLSVDHLRLALSSNCDGGSPTKALQFLLNATAQGRGLLEQAAYIASSMKAMRSLGRTAAGKASTRYYGVRGIERTAFYGWFGLMLAVQRQPVIVHIEASAPSFQDYDGSGTYADEACFTNHLNHVVLVVGYLVYGVDSAKPDLLPPFWIIRNSWGAEWGDQGHMRMDIRSGDGICGINTLPGLFPVVRMPADPCGLRSYKIGSLGPVFNPCGQFNCSTKGTGNRCKCSDARFAEVKNTDGSYTCAYVDVCGSSSRNPCVVGTCVNDGRGSYSCVCPRGFIQGTMIGGGFSCTPGQAQGKYKVLGANVLCSHITTVFSLPLADFLLLNKGVSCSKPLRINTEVYVISNARDCSVFYTTSVGDTCAGVGRQVQLCGEGASDAACETAFQALNPAVDCSSLKPSQAVCVERDPSKANRIAVCDEFLRPGTDDTCSSIRDKATPPLSTLELYRLNPGIDCNQPFPAQNFDFKGSLEQQICTKSSSSFEIGTCPTDNEYFFMPTDTCKSVQIAQFHGIKGCYRKMNGYECVDKMIPGTKVCLPNYDGARIGKCSF
ncbi:hypothetical protein CLOM_g14371 [Closterium sp. NIES-68]|nr:hypothetical protein CLOM_g14371 [Closterium sp. NIES-68]GJP84242.1 hypothetical protein CLOP_g14325 [Closterium sp. NIES-67]